MIHGRGVGSCHGAGKVSTSLATKLLVIAREWKGAVKGKSTNANMTTLRVGNPWNDLAMAPSTVEAFIRKQSEEGPSCRSFSNHNQ